jgi:hypothetical protein
MKRITKLTPDIISKIIAEEKLQLKQEINEREKREKIELYETLKFLKKLKNKKSKVLNEQKIIDAMTAKLVKKIKNRS